MNKGLEILEKVKHYDSRVGLHEDDYNTIKEELKSLWIIKNKWVDVELFGICKTLEAYNKRCTLEEEKLTQEEYDLLKEVLKND